MKGRRMDLTGRVDAVILDFDGTVADTMGFLTETAASLLSAGYGMTPDRARSVYIETSGLPFVQQMEIIFPGDPRNAETVRHFESAKRENLMSFKLYPDALPAISGIRGNGIKVCVSSSNLEDLIRNLLKSRGLEVDLVMGFRPGFEKGRDHFDFAGSTLNTELARLIFVGDSHRDGLTARSAGVRFIARAGLLDAGRIRDLLPGVPVIDSLLELLPLLGIEKAQGGQSVDTTS
jgi:phosphoglycolate phosphatase-like HAD superfamily hydrolase